MNKEEFKKILESLREDADSYDEEVKRWRYENNEREAQYCSGVAIGLRKAIIKFKNI